MRVFLAVTPDPELADAAHAWGLAVAGALAADDRRGLSWVPRTRIHVTLRFYGESTPADVEQLRRALADPAWAVPPFALGLGAAGTFPSGGRPRVLWLGLATGRSGLDALRADLDARPGAALPGGMGDTETWSPHLTIARVRRPGAPGLGRRLRDAVARVPPPHGSAAVDALTLYQSVPSPAGSTYVALARIPLAGGPPASR